MEEYSKLCPYCGKKQIYKYKSWFNQAIESNRTCNGCKGLRCRGENNPCYGRRLTDIEKQKISELTKASMTAEIKKKLSLNGQLLVGNKNPFFGKKHTEENNRLQRVFKLKRLEELGISPKEDKGAREFFQNQNECGFRFIENYFLKDLGYSVDGYEPYQHIICEFDTPYHNKPSQTKKDLVRQNNIIKYFEDIGRPLKDFVRVNSETLEVFRI